MEKRIHWVAVCQYPNKKEFLFYSREFVVDHWSDLDRVGKEMVESEWAEISPYPAPPIVEFLPGYLFYMGPDKK